VNSKQIYKIIHSIIDIRFEQELGVSPVLQTQIITLTSGGIKKEGEEYPLLLKNKEIAWISFFLELIKMLKQKTPTISSSEGYPLIYWRSFPEIKEINSSYVVSARLFVGYEGFR